MRKKIRILVVTSIHPDFDKRVWRHAKSLVALGLEVHLICPWNVEVDSVIEGVRMIPFQPVRRRLARIFKLPYRMIPLISKMLRHVDIIHFHDIDLLPAMMIFRLFRSTVYDVHENYPDEMLVRYWVPDILRRPLYWLVRSGQYLAALIIRNMVFVVPVQERDFPKRFIRKILIRNYSSIELLKQVKTGYEQRPRRIITIGTMYPENGAFLLIEIAASLKEMGVEAEIICSDRFSSVVLRDKFLEQVRARMLERFIRLTPSVPPPEIMDMLNRGRIGLLPNLRVPKQEKALPTRLFEYMAAGIPVVASDLPLIKHYVEDSQCGVLASPEDPGSFARAIVKLLDNQEMAMILGQNGQAAFKDRFSWESQMPALANFYRQILHGQDTTDPII
jgi:glycosyltransferase involved in cell wall biosynthesis